MFINFQILLMAFLVRNTKDDVKLNSRVVLFYTTQLDGDLYCQAIAIVSQQRYI